MKELSILANGSEGTTLSDIVFMPPTKSFILTPEQSLKDLMKTEGVHESFYADASPSFYDYDSLAHMEQVTGIKGLEEIINTSMTVVGHDFIVKTKKAMERGGNVPTNGASYGVSKIVKTRTADDEERAGAIISMHDANYLTSQVMNKVWKTLHEGGEPLINNNLTSMPQVGEISMAPFFSGFGVNATVIVDGHCVIGARPDGAWHVAMNEGARPSPETRKNGVSLSELYKRGMKEELRIDVEQEGVHQVPPAVREIFLCTSAAQDGQMGVHVLSKLNMSIEEFRERQEMAVDAYENSKLKVIPYTQEAVLAQANSPEPTIDYTRALLRGLSLDLCP